MHNVPVYHKNLYWLLHFENVFLFIKTNQTVEKIIIAPNENDYTDE